MTFTERLELSKLINEQMNNNKLPDNYYQELLDAENERVFKVCEDEWLTQNDKEM